MPKTVYAEINTDATEVDFGPNSPLHQYTNSLDANHQLSTIEDRLTHYLKKNNVKIKDGRTPEYTIEITDLLFSEKLVGDTYMDTCEFPALERDLTINQLTYTVQVALIQSENKSVLNELSRTIVTTESVPECSCGAIGASTINVSKVADDLTKELRKELADLIYIHKGF